VDRGVNQRERDDTGVAARAWPAPAGLVLAGLVGALLSAGCSKREESPLVAWQRLSETTSARELAALPPPATDFARLPEKLEFASGSWTTEVAFPGLTFDDPVALVPVPHTNQIFVSEREGRIYSFDNQPEVSTKTLVLDLTAVNQGEGDCGLLGIAFHPQFGDPGSRDHDYVYLHYSFAEEPVVGIRPPRTKSLRSRLSRFSVDRDSLTILRDSELVLINQRDDNVNHQGGAMFFHPRDRFLYLTVGDEGDCALGNCQRIDKDLFSGVLRIDVDMRGGAVSHPIPRQPEAGTTANYFIPNDNPFVGKSGVLEEFYAVGLRSPHRMTYDATDDLAWIGDVGEATREEIDLLKRGGNYQWPAFEGFRRVPIGEQRAKLPLPDPAPGVWSDPVLDFPHDEVGAVIGGYVYRGARLPTLRGRYVFGDYMTGSIWSFSYRRAGADVFPVDLDLLVTTQFTSASGGISSFGIDAQDELYFLTVGDAAKIHRLAPTQPFVNAPKLLSELVQKARQGAAPAGSKQYDVHGYEVQNPLWSDGARKQRWLALPRGRKVQFAMDGPWRFPEGTVLVKHFDIALDERRPAWVIPLETRFLVAGRDGTYYGLTYKWTEQGDDAEPVLERKTRDLRLIDSRGDVRRQRYEFPGPNDCMVCHNANAGHVLGVRTEQMNRPASASGDNQLATWSSAGVFTEALAADALAVAPRLANLADDQKSLEDRVRSYWASNCSMCHGVDRTIRSTWDARYATPLASQRVINVEPSELGAGGAAIVVPGDPKRSTIFRRSSTADRRKGAMPPLGHRRVDADYVHVLERWIESLGPKPPPAPDDPASRIPRDAPVFFGSDGVGPRYLSDGWSGPEPWGVWSDGAVAHVILPVETEEGPLTFELEVSGFVVPVHPTLHVECTINGVFAANLDFDLKNRTGWRRIPVPDTALRNAKELGVLDLQFKIANPANPKRLGVNEDIRDLGLALHRLKVAETP
jgi:glucose/arabinose dehydrogenase/mono/diheme cytochrome c family protein